MYDYPPVPPEPLSASAAVSLLMLVAVLLYGCWYLAMRLDQKETIIRLRRPNPAIGYNQEEIDDELDGIVAETIRSL